MRRKLIKQGMAGFTIYLPKQWIDRKGLKPGDEINIEELDAGLFINTTKLKKKSMSIEIKESNKQDIRHILTHAYRKGYDTITLKATKEYQPKIKEVVENVLLGFEVTKKDDKQISIESISEPDDQKYEVLLRRIFLIIKETQQLCHKDIEKGTFLHEEDIKDYRNQTDKYIMFCRRIINKERLREKDHILQWELLTFLMHIQHAYYYMYGYATGHSAKSSKPIILMLKELEIYFDHFYNAYYKKSIEEIHKMSTKKHEFQYGQCYKLIEKGKGPEAVLAAHLRELFRLMQIGTSPILGMLFSD